MSKNYKYGKKSIYIKYGNKSTYKKSKYLQKLDEEAKKFTPKVILRKKKD